MPVCRRSTVDPPRLLPPRPPSGTAAAVRQAGSCPGDRRELSGLLARPSWVDSLSTRRARALALGVTLTVTLAVAWGQFTLAAGAAGGAGAVGATVLASISLAVLAGLAAGLVTQVLALRLAGRHREPAPLRVRAQAAYLEVTAPADPDRPGRVRSRAPGRQCP